jgi:hypothetical protein
VKKEFIPKKKPIKTPVNTKGKVHVVKDNNLKEDFIRRAYVVMIQG